MEPWVYEQQRQMRWEQRRARMPRCQRCQEHIWTERYLDMEAFGLQGYVCEACMEENTGYTEHLQQEVLID